MKKKQMKLGLGKLTVANLTSEDQDRAKGGWDTFLTVYTSCCTVDPFTCTMEPVCEPITYQGVTTCP